MKGIFSVAASAAIAAGLLIAPVSVNAAPAVNAPSTVVVATPAEAKPKAKKAKVSVKLSASSKKPVVGRNVTLKATVKKNGKAVKGATVTFKRYHSMEGTVATIGKAKTNKSGVATFKRKVAKWDGDYVFTYSGKTATVNVMPRANLSWSLPAKKTLYRGEPLKFNVNSPSFQDSTVQLQMRDKKDEKWIPANGMIHSFTPDNLRARTECPYDQQNCFIIGSKDKASVKLWYFEIKGTYKFRLFQEGIQVHSNSYTKPVTVTVK